MQLIQRIQAFRTAALKSGFVDMAECGDGTVLWFKRVTIPAVPETHQRVCIDPVTNSATVYWTTVQGRIVSKTFRSVTTLQEWMSDGLSVQQLNTVGLDSSIPVSPPSGPHLSIAARAGKPAS
jgi:hypothetical protein